jgi:ABC-type glutathione transport system ATPase component
LDRRAPGIKTVSLLAFEDVDKRFVDGYRVVTVLEGASLELCPGETLGVRGSRRAGKSTLLKRSLSSRLRHLVVEFSEQSPLWSVC